MERDPLSDRWPWCPAQERCTTSSVSGGTTSLVHSSLTAAAGAARDAAHDASREPGSFVHNTNLLFM